MKRILLVLMLSVLSDFVFSQNLQFSQVQFFSGTVSVISGSASLPSYIVPSGKVWKIESAYSELVNVLGLSINGNIFRVNPQGNGTYSAMVFPIWLNAGDVIQPTVFNPQSGTGSYYISIIEFSIQ